MKKLFTTAVIAILIMSCNNGSVPTPEAVKQEKDIKDSIAINNLTKMMSPQSSTEPFYRITTYKITYAADLQTSANFDLTLELADAKDTVVSRQVESSQVGTLLTMLNQCDVRHQLIRQGYIVTPKTTNNATAKN